MSAHKNAKGRWYCSFRYYDETLGRKRQKKHGSFSTKKEALAWQADFIRRLEKSPKMTLSELIDLYYDDRAVIVKASTMSVKKYIIEKWVRPQLGNKAIDTITSADISKWQKIVLSSDLSEYSKRNINKTLGILFNHAVKNHVLNCSPMRDMDQIGAVTKRVVFWKLEEYQKFMSAADLKEDARLAIEVLFYSGLRLGELLALTWADVDLKENTINVDKTLYGGNITTPKTKKSIRTVAMPKKVMDDIRGYKDRLYLVKDDMHPFAFSTKYIERAITRNCEAAGVKRIVVHGLRHSHASLLIHLGYSTKIIAERLGDTEQMIMNVYGHLYDDDKKLVAAALDKL